MIHVHSCPQCYEREQCDMDCYIEPDLGMTRSGYPHGYHNTCSKCAADPAPSLRDAVDTFLAQPQESRDAVIRSLEADAKGWADGSAESAEDSATMRAILSIVKAATHGK